MITPEPKGLRLEARSVLKPYLLGWLLSLGIINLVILILVLKFGPYAMKRTLDGSRHPS